MPATCGRDAPAIAAAMTASVRCKVCGVIKPTSGFPLEQRHPILSQGNRPHTCSRCVLIGQQRRIEAIRRQIEAQPERIAQAVVRAAHNAATPPTFSPRAPHRLDGVRRRVADALFRLSLRISPNFPRAARG